jgi:hypothetical protein
MSSPDVTENFLVTLSPVVGRSDVMLQRQSEERSDRVWGVNFTGGRGGFM